MNELTEMEKNALGIFARDFGIKPEEIEVSANPSWRARAIVAPMGIPAPRAGYGMRRLGPGVAIYYWRPEIGGEWAGEAAQVPAKGPAQDEMAGDAQAAPEAPQAPRRGRPKVEK